MLDADGSTDPAEIPQFLGALLEGNDFAKGSRFSPGGRSTDITTLRGGQSDARRRGKRAVRHPLHRPLLRLQRLLASLSLLYGVTCDGFEVETLINVRIARAGLAVAEVPSVEYERLNGESKLNAMRDGMRVLRTIMLSGCAGRHSAAPIPTDGVLRSTSCTCRWRRFSSQSSRRLRRRAERSRLSTSDGRPYVMTTAPIPVLLYHSVADGEAASSDRFAVSPRQFSEHVAAIAASGRVPLTVSELASALRGEAELSPRSVAVTFDDGYADTPAAVSLLAAHGLTSTVYVTSGRIGARDGIDVAALEAIIAAGAEIGSHTVTHPHLDELRIAAAAREIADSRAAVADAIARSVASFAYPHGAHDARVRRAVIDAGFSSAAAVKNALSHPADDPFAIARVTIVADTSTAAVNELLAGRGAPLAWARERVRTRVYREVRKARRHIDELAQAVRGEHGD